MARKRTEEPVVHSVTTVAAAPEDDMGKRMRNYLVMMGFRILCFVLLVVVNHPVRWVFVFVAVFVPYFAVVIANASAPRKRGEITPVTPQERIPHQLGR